MHKARNYLLPGNIQKVFFNRKGVINLGVKLNCQTQQWKDFVFQFMEWSCESI